ncbi:phosphate acyltransferase PlsX [Candidatus Bandiella euplotis]|uniref:Phosphate acyltransferase n=1 Tax=Candidatus Bandiella euplotis TaxID=1664265 RepID=A0ABZ0UNR5_9RICK|nr:phosphate acyltransferase PlsX [Candidatus Bandiella woodruffii]WPX96738.1 Phosphate acyltransferase [Candidatus Bandiella woodruffii]
MSQKILISIDAMGGANSPSAVVEAIGRFLATNGDTFFQIYGKKMDVLPYVILHQLPKNRYKLINCDEAISDDDKPTEAWRNGKNSSMRKAIEAVQNGQAHTVVSCGNTGALMLIAKMLLGTIGNIKRPAIAGVFPNMKKDKTIVLDMGANLECSETHLFQFALMGSCFARALFQKENPKVGILNVGSETSKGRELEQMTYKILEESELNFVGFVEGHEVAQGKVDVLVTDGFSGNIFLKASEGAAGACIDLVKASIEKGNVIAKLAGLVLKQSIGKSFKHLSPDANNGAMFMGLKGIVIKSHGSASVDGIVNAISTAHQLVEYDINTKISEELALFEAKGVGLNFVDIIKQTSAKILGLKE